MKKVNKLLSLILIGMLLFTASGCKNESKSYIVSENVIKDLFIYNASLESGLYTFSKFEEYNGVSFLYKFSYEMESNLCNSNLFIVSRTGNVKTYDYASICFKWGKLKEGTFYAYHDFNNLSKIEFSFNNLIFNDDSTFGDEFSYNVISNTFNNLTDESSQNEYSSKMFECLKQALAYCRMVLYEYQINTDLW